jgi:hypothetical protein
LRVVLLCPFTAGTVLWQAQDGGYTLTVCVKGTFSLVHGREAILADAQEPIAGDRHLGDDPRAGLYAASELIPYKPRADVTLVGSAFAPDQEPVEALVARLALGELDKSLGVIGDRFWIEGPDGPEPSPPRPFSVMPLRDERAVLAPDNPLGFDLTRPPAIGAPALPNLEAADDEIGAGRTVGFGPVLPGAGARWGLIAPEGRAWVEGGGRGPVPAGFDFSFYNAAPRDQQIELVRAGAPLVLENLSRDHGRFETRLPTVRPKAFLVPGEIEHGIEVILRCDTVWIDTDRALLTLTWRGLTGVSASSEEALGTLVVAAESKGREVRYKHIEKMLRDGFTSSTDGEGVGETHPLGLRHDGVSGDAPRPSATPRGALRSATDIRPVPAPPPSIYHAPATPLPAAEREDTRPPPSYEELSSADLLESTATEEPTGLSRIDIVSPAVVMEDPFTEELSTVPLRVVPAQAAGELSVADYARITVAVERGAAAEVLSGYGLALPDLAHVTSRCSERAAAEPGFAGALARALASARRA